MQRHLWGLILCACSESQAPIDDPPPPPVLAWTPCAIITGETGTGAECGEADVPVDWNDADGPRMRVFVKRVGRVDAPTQMWMLNGGPGASGADFDPLAEQLA